MAKLYGNNTSVLFVMATPAEKEAIRLAAKWEGVSMNELVRRAARLYIKDQERRKKELRSPFPWEDV